MNHRYSETLRKAAPSLAQWKNGYEMMQIIAEHERNLDEPDPLGWDTAEALHHIGTYYHGGQWCPLYVMQCLGFNPGLAWTRPERNTSAATLTAQLVRLAR